MEDVICVPLYYNLKAKVMASMKKPMIDRDLKLSAQNILTRMLHKREKISKRWQYWSFFLLIVLPKLLGKEYQRFKQYTKRGWWHGLVLETNFIIFWHVYCFYFRWVTRRRRVWRGCQTISVLCVLQSFHWSASGLALIHVAILVCVLTMPHKNGTNQNHAPCAKPTYRSPL